MRYSKLALSLALATLTGAESTTTASYFGAFWDTTSVDSAFEIPYYTSIAASVVDINALETTYAVDCLSGAPTSLCSMDDPWTIIQGETTMSFTGVYTAFQEDVTITVDRDFECTFTNKIESASCSYSVGQTGTVGGEDYATSASSSGTLPTESVGYYEMEVTGGVDKFTSPEATETPGVAAGGPAGALITAAPALAAVVAALL